MSANQENTIESALRALGVSRGHVQTEEHYGRCIVYLDGKQFGIWDFARGTFVD